MLYSEFNSKALKSNLNAFCRKRISLGLCNNSDICEFCCVNKTYYMLEDTEEKIKEEENDDGSNMQQKI